MRDLIASLWLREACGRSGKKGIIKEHDRGAGTTVVGTVAALTKQQL